MEICSKDILGIANVFLIMPKCLHIVLKNCQYFPKISYDMQIPFKDSSIVVQLCLQACQSNFYWLLKIFSRISSQDFVCLFVCAFTGFQLSRAPGDGFLRAQLFSLHHKGSHAPSSGGCMLGMFLLPALVTFICFTSIRIF